MAVAITGKDKTAQDVRAVSAKCKDAKAARRMLAIAMVLEGYDRMTAAEPCGMDRQTLRDWVHRYNAEGPEGLSNRRSGGRSPRLTSEQKATLADWVRAGPDLAKDGVVRWRRIDLKHKIEAEFGVVMHERTVSKELAALGFRRLSVRPQHPKSDPDAPSEPAPDAAPWIGLGQGAALAGQGVTGQIRIAAVTDSVAADISYLPWIRRAIAFLLVLMLVASGAAVFLALRPVWPVPQVVPVTFSGV